MTADRTRKAPAKKATTKKTAAKKTSAKKAAAKNAPAKKAPAKKTTASQDGDSDGPTKRPADAPRAESRPRSSAADVAQRAVEQLTQLTGKAAEAVTGIEQNHDGWRVSVEVLEVRRIPETTDVLARYDIDTDDNGDLTGYRRAGRYTRGSARED